MKYFVIILVLIGFVAITIAIGTQFTTAEKSIDVPKELIPEPEPEQAFDYTTCGEGTSYQEGICVADKTDKKSVKSSDCWGGPACTYDELP